MRKPMISTGCGILALLLVLPLLCGATTYYVRTDGNDGNDGLTNTPAGAKATFIAGMIGMADGDTLVFAPGIYDSSVATYSVFRSNVTFRGSDAVNRPVLAKLGLTVASTANGVTFENLVFDGAHTMVDLFYLENGSQNVTLRNCELRDPSLVNAVDNLRHGLIRIDGCNTLLLEDCRLAVYGNIDIGNRIHMLIAQYDTLNAGFSNTNWTVRNTEFYGDRTVLTDADCAAIYLWHNVSGFLIEGCTFGMVGEALRIVSTDPLETARVYSGLTMRNNGIIRVEMLNAVYLGSNNVYRDFLFEGNLLTNAEDSGIYLPGAGTAVADGFEVSGNAFEDVGYDDTGTDRAITMDEVVINPSSGKRVVIRNNRFVRPSVGADECIWLNLAGSDVEISDNEFGNYQGTCLLVDGAESLSPMGTLSNVQIVGNAHQAAPATAIAIRCFSEMVNGLSVENNSVVGAGGSGIEIRDASGANALIRNNSITGAQQGIRVAAPGVTITYNDIFDSANAAGAGILLNQYDAPSDVDNCLIAWNVVAGNQNCGILLDPALAANSQNVSVMNNTVVSNVTSGIRVGLDGCHVWNNIIAFHSGTGLSFEATTPGAIGYNLLFNALSGGSDYSGFVSTPLTGDLIANPMFESPLTRNFHLRAASPAIGAGAARMGGTGFIANGSDLGALPTHVQNLSVPPSSWSLYR